MAKEKQKKILVSIYSDEVEAIKAKLSIEEVSGKTVREAIGLPQTHSRVSVTGALIKEIRALSDEEKEKLYAKVKGKK